VTARIDLKFESSRSQALVRTKVLTGVANPSSGRPSNAAGHFTSAHGPPPLKSPFFIGTTRSAEAGAEIKVLLDEIVYRGLRAPEASGYGGSVGKLYELYEFLGVLGSTGGQRRGGSGPGVSQDVGW
jgi:hypothetical protein